ncbi:hypothetical protein K431DRAFT_316948 [Polychaeton citri CBS 116435]|uniref:Uncharacterized protein n=1 Tax=Polychaeton citri CBS 116435 TaxID=1314669 RepID=A0A9P4PVN5_9PEZI|nr:hypothetical protein K431DRAFT_316948 [Polychaeton citri CBS 116435]
MENDADLKEELGTFTLVNARNLSDAGKNSVLWEYMPEIHDTNAMKLARSMIEQFRAQKNKFGFARKMVFACHKPMNIAIFNLYIQYLATRSDYLAVNSVDDYVLVDSWSSGKVKKNQGKVASFKTTMTKAEGYMDKPFLMNAVASQILVGVSLPPADVVVLLDGNWAPSHDEQLSGRVQRNRSVQKADFTESYRFIAVSSYCPLGIWQSARHTNMATIKTQVQEAAQVDAEQEQ